MRRLHRSGDASVVAAPVLAGLAFMGAPGAQRAADDEDPCTDPFHNWKEMVDEHDVRRPDRRRG